jgi:hypothetical protein
MTQALYAQMNKKKKTVCDGLNRKETDRKHYMKLLCLRYLREARVCTQRLKSNQVSDM